MGIDSSPTSSGSSLSSINKEVIQIDSIDIQTEHLNRQELLYKLTGLVAEYRFVRLTSPAASGKSSLLKMYQHSLKNTKVVWISCLTDKSCFDLFVAIGIDLENLEYKSNIGKRNTIIFLDDAQEKYMEVRFWEQLIKMTPNWLPSNIRFVISSTHLVSIGTSSPVVLKLFQNLKEVTFYLLQMNQMNFWSCRLLVCLRK